MSQDSSGSEKGEGAGGERKPPARHGFFEGGKQPPAPKKEGPVSGAGDGLDGQTMQAPRSPAGAKTGPSAGGLVGSAAAKRSRAQFFSPTDAAGEPGAKTPKPEAPPQKPAAPAGGTKRFDVKPKEPAPGAGARGGAGAPRAERPSAEDARTLDVSERDVLEATAAGRAGGRSAGDTAMTMDEAAPELVREAGGKPQKAGASTKPSRAEQTAATKGDSGGAGKPAGVPVADPYVGKTIGGCRLEKFLGRGGMGTVYYAIQIDLDRPVAFKILSPQLTSDPRQVAQFFREAKALAKVEHPNIVPIYNAAKEEEVHFIVMKLVEGGSLEGVLKREGPKLPIERAMKLVDQAAKGLLEAHLKGITHRDVKPENMLVDPETDRLMVTDFGLAHVEGDTGMSFGEGRIVGTPYYMSPEQIDGREVDGRTDIYALGATLYYMVTGVRPFVAETPVEILLKHVNEELVAPIKRAPDVPQAVSRIIEKMLVKDRDRRYQSLREVLKDLDAASRGQDVKVDVSAEEQAPAALAGSIFEGAALGSVAGSALASAPATAAVLERPRSFYYMLAGLGASTLAALLLGAGPIREIVASGAEVSPREIAAERTFSALEKAGDRSKAALEKWKRLADEAKETSFAAEAQKRVEELQAELSRVADDRVRKALEDAQRERAAGRHARAIEMLRAVPADARESPLAKALDKEVAATIEDRARNFRQAYVPAGAFVFCENELKRNIELPAFYIDLTEVSNRDWLAFVQGGGRAPARWGGGQPPPGTDDLPVTGVSVKEALAFAKSRGKRLPNIYEWEKAARGPEGRRFPWGGDLDMDRANQRESGPGKLEPVEGRPKGASPFGCLHMAGNAAEWAILPQAPDATTEPEAWVKGGAYGDDLVSCRAAYWLEVDRETKAQGHEAIGLRLVEDVK